MCIKICLKKNIIKQILSLLHKSLIFIKLQIKINASTCTFYVYNEIGKYNVQETLVKDQFRRVLFDIVKNDR